MSSHVQQRIEQIYDESSRRVYASLARLLRDLDLAEDAMQEAFAMASDQWPSEGVPNNPVSWLVSTGRFKAIDIIRRRERFHKIGPDLHRRLAEIAQANEQRQAMEIRDDRLQLIFTCCHPAIDPRIQVPLTLREVCGLTTDEIARAFLTTPDAMAQRLVRGKAKIRDAGIPIVIPEREELPQRLDGVLRVIYLIFNEGYSASAGESLTRVELTSEAIRLGRLVLELCPDAEVMGLLALMLLHESRRETRTNKDGAIVLLADQDRGRWNRDFIREGKGLVERSFKTRRFGSYTLQAAISAVHADASSSTETDWPQIVALYDLLLRVSPSPVVSLNRAVAIAMRDGPDAGLILIDSLLDSGELTDYSLAHSARGELLSRIARFSDARDAFRTAIHLTNQKSERQFLRKKLENLVSE